MVHNQDFGAGKQSFERPPQPQSIILNVQQCRDRRHVEVITVPLECTTRVYDEAIQVGENQKRKGMRSSAPLRTKLPSRDLVDYSVTQGAAASLAFLKDTT